MRRAVGVLIMCGVASTTVTSQDWPTFRGLRGAGVADGMRPPTVWDVEKGLNVKWKTPIPGRAHSSPVVWGDRVFITTAVPTGDAAMPFRHGEQIQGAGVAAATKDDVKHTWRVYALQKGTGTILWERVAYEGVPKTARHVMQTQADSTPATDGRHLVAFFGSQGLFCYDMDGKLLWKRDLGSLDSGFYIDPTYQYNTSSSPIIYKNLVFLQVDLLKDSFIAAFDLESGNDVWRSKRDEMPSWATPFLFEGPTRTELVTAAPNFTRSYEPTTGKELWRLGRHSYFSTPTPFAGLGLIFIASGGGTTVQPIYAIRPGATGDITLKAGEDTNEYIVWSTRRGGPYLPTPILYGDLLYTCANNGVLSAFEATTGKRVYQERLTRGGSYSASPVAADGKIYFANEDGAVVVVKAGPTFEKLAENPMGEVVMATPAIAPGMLIVRMQYHVVAVAERTAN